MHQSILRLPDVMSRTGLSRSTIYARMNAKPPTFPEPVNLGERAVGWVESEIEEWIQAKIESRAAA